MDTARLKQLERYRRKMAALQRGIDRDRARTLGGLHKEYGFPSTQELIKAIRAAVKTAGSNGSASARSNRSAPVRRRRASLTPDLKQKIRIALVDGKTGVQVAKRFRVSLASIYAIKRGFGLLRPAK